MPTDRHSGDSDLWRGKLGSARFFPNAQLAYIRSSCSSHYDDKDTDNICNIDNKCDNTSN